MQYLLIIPITVLGMLGGQVKKEYRRYGIASLSALLSYQKKEKKSLWLLVLIPILSMGYGVDSTLTRIFKYDWLVRIVYALILSSLFVIEGLFKYSICTTLLVTAFSIRAGSLGRIGKYDILIEDIIRYSTLGFCIVFVYL